MESKYITEICCGSYEDGLAAFEGGAGRIELNSALHMGGLSPSMAALQLLKKQTGLEIVCMVRPRGGGFCYSGREFEAMMEEARLFLEAGADGLAFGFLKEDKTVDLPKTRAMCELVHQYGKTAVFHRALDVAADIHRALEDIIACGADRVLTSGGQPVVPQGIRELQELETQYGDKIQILAGGGVRGYNAAQILKDTGVHQLHSSCKAWKTDPTARHKDLNNSFDTAHPGEYDIVDAGQVKDFVQAVRAFERDAKEA